jgi:hypothetical protein
MVNVKITHDPNNAGPREERMANLDVAASHAITFGITCTITVPREPRSGRPVEQVYSFVAGVLLQGEGHPVVTEDSLAWWCRRASEPYRGSSVAFVTLRDAAGKVWPRVTVRGAGGLVGLAERYRLEVALASALAGHATGLLEPQPGHARAYDTTRGVNMTPVDIDLRGATILAWSDAQISA